MYVKSNGNGGVEVSNTAMALVTLLILLITISSSAVAYSVGVRSDVDNLQKQWEIAGPIHKEIIEGIEEKLDSHDNYISATEVRLVNMQDDLSEIKEDVKEMLRK